MSAGAGPEDMSFRARALAQAHPLTPLAKRFVDRAVADQRTSQPLPEIGIWAGAGLIKGYCLRRVEEEDVGMTLDPGAASTERPLSEGDEVAQMLQLEESATRIAADLRTEGTGSQVLGDEGCTLAALDGIIASEVRNRLDHWRDSIDEAAWGELEEYLTWWVVKGYALRAAEAATWTGAASLSP